jgi:6-methylsalicylate decarboxylase
VRFSATRTDVHQHLWSDSLVAALASRPSPPRAGRVRGGFELVLSAEPRSPLTPDDPARRAALLSRDGVDRALIALSAALGVEELPVDQADSILSAYAQDVRELPTEFRAWGAIPLADPDPRRIDALLDEGFAGLCLPAGAVSSRPALDRLGPALERLERRGAPLFVHPGPARTRVADAPAWWPAVADYVPSLHRAWLAWAAFGRPQHRSLRVLFAALAGLAPLQAERLTARGGPPAACDALCFYDTSSYGPGAIEAMARAVGREQLVYGSDRPVVTPSYAPDEDLASTTPARLLGWRTA